MKVVISSGHGKYIRGAHGLLDEVDEARRVVEAVADRMRSRTDSIVVTYHDDVSTTQNENLKCIVDFHNSQLPHDLDVSVHFNAYVETDDPRGTEVLFVTQRMLAEKMSWEISEAGGFIDRGEKYRPDVFFLNNTVEPAILIEVCFVDSQADADLYNEKFDAICDAIADVLSKAKVA